MQGQGTVQPLRDLVLVERLEGHGIETVSPGGIIIPATTEAKAKTKADTFRARVVALGPEARDLRVGEVVLVFTWAGGDGSQLYTGVEALGPHQFFIRPDDIVCVYESEAA